MKDYKNQEIQAEEDKNKKRRIILIIILILLLLLLLTSCTSNFWGKIGDLFRNEGNFTIDPDTNDPEVVLNKDLRFSADSFAVFVSDSKVKLSYYYQNINPSEIICSTSDASIATCYVQDDYVVINPKKAGMVDIILQAETNGKIYKAVAKLEVKPADQKIHLFEDKDTININYTNQKVFSYQVEGIYGKITVTSSDETIAKAEVKDGLIIITPIRPGKVFITVTIENNGTTIVKVYELIITGEENPNKPNGGNNNGGGSGNPSTPNIPGKPENPDLPSFDVNSLLKELTISNGILNFKAEKFEYHVGVDANVSKVTLTAIPNSNKASITYTYNGKTVNSLNDLTLNTGDNIVFITVTAENGETSVYQVVINRASESDNTLSNIMVDQGKLSPNFNKNVLDYTVIVDYNTDQINIDAILSDSKANIQYEYNGKTVDSLHDLSLNVGDNKVKVIVTGENGEKRTYYITVTRQEKGTEDKKDSNSLLSNLTVSSGSLSFNSFTFDYIVGVSSEVNKISLVATPSSNKSTVRYTYNGKMVNSLNDLSLNTGDNRVIITVTAEDGSVSIYTVTINKASESDNTLANITTDKGSLYPTFHKNILDYQVTVEADVNDITLMATPTKNTSKVEYIYEGNVVTSLDHLPLQTGKNTVKIVVTGEDGNKRTYQVVINKKSSDNNLLSKLEVFGEAMNETFEPNRYDYTMNVPYDTENVSMAAEAEDPRSKVSYTLNGEAISDLNNMPLKEGKNELKITVTSQSGKDQVYTVTILKPIRTIEVESKNHVISFEDTPYPIVYKILEDGNLTSDYDVNDIKVNIVGYKGTYEIKKDYVLLNPDISMKDKEIDMEINYRGKLVKTHLSFTMKDYELRPEKNQYDIDFVGGIGKGNLILNTNMFDHGTVIRNISGGIRISSAKDPRIYVDVTTDSKLITLSSTAESDKVSSLAIQLLANNSGKAKIKVTGSAFGYQIGTYEINVNIVAKFEVNIYANSGFFNEDILEYHLKVTNLDTIQLSDYVPYKESDSGNCMYYVLEKYNTKADGTGTDYDKEAIITNLNQDLDLYAIYSSDDRYIELVLPYKYYLTEVDLFHNEDYFKAYGKDKVIYPGAHGSYVMTFDNETTKEIVITGISLEEDTICIDGKGCLNMGYIIKHSPKEANNYTYYYGSSTQYTILNKDAATTLNGIHTERNIVFEPSAQITVPVQGATEISLLWEWVDQDDILDTLIGNEAANLNDRYVLYVSLDFTKLHSHCSID